MTELQGTQLEKDVAELRRVLESHSPDTNMHANHSLTNSQSFTVTPTTQVSFMHESIQSSYAQPSTVTHTTQTPFMHENTQSSSYAQPTVTQHKHLLCMKIQSSSYARQNFHDTTQTFTHKPHAAATHAQHIGSRLNTPHNTQLQALNIWPTSSSSHLPSSLSSIQASKEFYNFHVRPEIQAIYGRMDQLALEIQQIHQKLDRVLTQMSNNRRHVPEKPAFLPISLVEDVEIFETANDEEYMKLVNYLIFIGGLNAKESVNLCFKEIFQDSLMNLYTWFGREDNQRPLYNTRLVNAIYDAICENKNFERPMRAVFQTYMRDALRTAKQRHRNRARNNLHRPEGKNRNERALWSDEHDEMQPEEN